jgi:hypothetical protein
LRESPNGPNGGRLKERLLAFTFFSNNGIYGKNMFKLMIVINTIRSRPIFFIIITTPLSPLKVYKSHGKMMMVALADSMK